MALHSPLGVSDYYSPLNAQPQALRRLPKFAMPCVYILVGLLLGWGLTTAQRPAANGAQFRWVRSPARWLRQDAQATQLYDAGQVERFVNLRRRIDEEFNTKLNVMEAPAEQFSPIRLSLELLERIDSEFDRFLQSVVAAGSTSTVFKGMQLPDFDVEENNFTISIACRASGLSPQHTVVDLKGQYLRIGVQREVEDETSHAMSHFSRIFILPEGVTSKDVAASMDGDELRVVVTKPPAQVVLPEIITIQASADEE